MQGEAVHIDFETRSATDLTKAGVFRYVEDPTTWPWGFCYEFDGDPNVYEWRPGWPDPVKLLAHIRSGGIVKAHNAVFEREVWNSVIVARICPHWPRMTIRQQDCTMSRAAAVSLPQALEKLGEALDLPFKKDMEGHAVMRKQMKPRRYNEDGSVTWWDNPELTDKNMAYCAQDVRTEIAADLALPPLTERSRRLWELDQVINERGIPIDTHAVERAAQLVEFAKKQNDKIMRDITDRAVPKCSNDKKIIEWLNSRGVQCTSLAKGEVEDVVFMAGVADDEAAMDAIKLRQAAWKTSTAKYRAMQKCVNSDGRIRGLLNFQGAGPGRWAGRLVQPQNFPRNLGGPEEKFDDDFLATKIAWLHDLLASARSVRDVYEMIVAVHGPLEVLHLLSKALRSVIKAPEGKRFVGGDFSNIEGRINAWLANEMWKVQAFADFDRGVGHDLYKLAYARSFGVPVEDVGKGQKRQIGKVQELALGYQGGVRAYLTMGANYGVNPYELSKPVYEATNAAQWDATAMRYHAPNAQKHDLFEREWTALQVLVDNWRSANPAIVQSWWNYQDAAIEAVAAPGNIVYPEHTRRVSYYADGRSLWCTLPSGRLIHYSSPWVVEEYREYQDRKTGEMKSRLTRKVNFKGLDSVTKQWRTNSLYGGLQCENIVQGTAADVLFDAMFRLEAEGYPIILTVHDEVLAEVDKFNNYHNQEHFADVMSVLGPEYDGLPVSVGAWEDERYVK